MIYIFDIRSLFQLLPQANRRKEHFMVFATNIYCVPSKCCISHICRLCDKQTLQLSRKRQDNCNTYRLKTVCDKVEHFYCKHLQCVCALPTPYVLPLTSYPLPFTIPSLPDTAPLTLYRTLFIHRFPLRPIG